MEAVEDIELIALAAFASVTDKDCDNWITDSEIYN